MTKQDDSVKVGDDVTTKTAAATKTNEPPKAEKVEVEGKTYEVPPEVAAAIAKARKEVEDKGTAAAATEAELRRQLEAATKKPAGGEGGKTGDANDDLETLLFTNPKEALAKVKADILAEVRGETAQRAAQTGFWQHFYEKNPELKDADLVVKAVMGREMAKLAPLTVEKAAEVLAEASQKELLRLGVVKKGKPKANPAEGGTEGASGGSKDTGDVSESSQSGISAALKARRTARREARTAS